MAVNYNVAPIVTDGLVLHLDAANVKSYPGSGTTWTDLSGNGFNATLVNGPTYSSTNNGSIVFDGIDDYASYENSTGLSAVFNGSVNFSILAIFNPISGGYILDIGNIGADPTGGLEFTTTNIARNNTSGGSSTLSATVATLSWNHVAFTRSSSLLHSWYLNGNFSNSAQTTEEYSVSQLVKTGRRAFNTSGIFKGNISVIMVYSRVLTTAEIQQNFQATRGRYGI